MRCFRIKNHIQGCKNTRPPPPAGTGGLHVARLPFLHLPTESSLRGCLSPSGVAVGAQQWLSMWVQSFISHVLPGSTAPLREAGAWNQGLESLLTQNLPLHPLHQGSRPGRGGPFPRTRNPWLCSKAHSPWKPGNMPGPQGELKASRTFLPPL